MVRTAYMTCADIPFFNTISAMQRSHELAKASTQHVTYYGKG